MLCHAGSFSGISILPVVVSGIDTSLLLNREHIQHQFPVMQSVSDA
jgi:hypothetical protein